MAIILRLGLNRDITYQITDRGSDHMKLLNGINFGGYLSQCHHNAAHYDAFIHEGDVVNVAEWGFDHIRIPIDYEVLEDESGEAKTENDHYIDRFIDWCQKQHLNVVLDLHKAYGYDFNDAGNSERNNLFTSERLRQRFIRLWIRLAKRYGQFEGIAFELLNEVVEENNAELWNELIEDTVKAIRIYAPTVPIIYGGIQWNSAKTLKLLRKPEDPNIIYTFHLYEPLLFTHQKAHWVPNMIMDKDIDYPKDMSYFKEESQRLGDKGKDVVDSDCTEMGIPFIEEMVREAVEAAENAGARLYCGEFGVIDRAPVRDTLRWFKDVLHVFRKYDIGSAVWSYREMDFGISDSHYDPIRDSLLELLTQK